MTHFPEHIPVVKQCVTLSCFVFYDAFS